MLASAAHGMKKRMAQPPETGCGPSSPNGSALRPSNNASMRPSKLRACLLFLARWRDAARLGFSDGTEFSAVTGAAKTTG